jgi:predicted metal-dependent peptidase
MSVFDKLASGRLIAARKAPYFRAMIQSLVPHPVEGLGTIGVTKDALLVYDPEWVEQRSEDEMGALYWHEVMHLVLDHYGRRGDKNPRLYNIAGDIFINDQGRNMGLVFPPGGCFPEVFGFPKNLSTEEYYALLYKQAEEAIGKIMEALQKSGAWKSGECGSGAGNELKDEPEGGKAADAGARSESEVQQTRLRVAEAVKQHVATKGRGNMPLGMDRWADEATKPPKVPWQSVLGRVVRQAVSFRPGAVDYSFSRISRRQGGIGFGPGRPIVPAFVRPVPRVMVWLDTSGSMSQDQLVTGLGETAGVLRAAGAEIEFGSCDYAVHAVGRVENPQQLAKLVKGGGGSSFIPAFEHMQKMRVRPQIAIFMTDGDIGVPPVAPKGIRVIWLLIDAYRNDSPTLAYGDRIVVSSRDGVQ